MTIAVLGATGKTGRHLVPALLSNGQDVTAIGRSRGKLDALVPKTRSVVADLTDRETVLNALKGARTVVSLAHARFAETVIACLPATCTRLVLTGSTRKFTSLADPAADAVRTGEAVFEASGVPGIMLHPSMIYGAREDRNVNRILGVLKRYPRRMPLPVPLPDGGRHTVQPVFVDDVIAAFVAAIERPTAGVQSIVVAGPQPILYRDMIAACAEAVGRKARIVPVPIGAICALAAIARTLGAKAVPAPAAWRRLTEDKVFDVEPLASVLGVRPRSFEDGLRLKMERGWVPWSRDIDET